MTTFSKWRDTVLKNENQMCGECRYHEPLNSVGLGNYCTAPVPPWVEGVHLHKYAIQKNDDMASRCPCFKKRDSLTEDEISPTPDHREPITGSITIDGQEVRFVDTWWEDANTFCVKLENGTVQHYADARIIASKEDGDEVDGNMVLINAYSTQYVPRS